MQGLCDLCNGGVGSKRFCYMHIPAHFIPPETKVVELVEKLIM